MHGLVGHRRITDRRRVVECQGRRQLDLPPFISRFPLIAPLEVSLSAFGAPSEQAWVSWSTNGVESEPQTSKLPLRLAPPFAPMSPWPLGVWFLVTAYIPPLLESQLSTMPLVKLLKPMTPHPVPVAKSP